MLDECRLPVLQAQRIDHALSLHAAQAGFDDFPLAGVDHDRNTGDVGFAHDEVEEASHGFFAFENALVHVDVDDLRAVLHLLPRHFQGLDVVAALDQSAEPGGACDVRTFADIDEQRVRGDFKGFEAAESQVSRPHRRPAWFQVPDAAGDLANVGRRGAAAPSHHVDHAPPGEVLDDVCHRFRRLIVFAEFVG